MRKSQIIFGTTAERHGYINSKNFSPELIKFLEEKTNISRNNFYIGEQVHSDNIHIIKNTSDKNLIAKQEQIIPKVDSLITNQPNILLLVKHADCVPIFFQDKTKQVIGIAHSGWKGTILDIGLKALHKIQSEFKTSIQDIQINIGPCARKCCYTHDNISVLNDKPEWKNYTKYNIQNTKYYLDLPGYIKHQFTKAGVPQENITDSNICTICNTQYWSWRRQKAEGSMQVKCGVSFIGLGI